MNKAITFNVKSLCFDENYNPSQSTRITTNFANLARGEKRQQNLRNALTMIDNRLNSLAHWDNPKGDRYAVELEIISVEMNIAAEGKSDAFPVIEVLKTNIVDRKTNERIEGIVGNNFSSYVRDYDFSVLLSEYNKNQPQFGTPDNFGNLHGNIFKRFVASDSYKEKFSKAPVICLSVSSKNVYHRTGNQHPVLGIEYQQDNASLTDRYFAKMGLRVRYFMPHNCHRALAITGAVGLATACVSAGTVVADLLGEGAQHLEQVRIEHPSGGIDVALSRSGVDGKTLQASVVRTARRLFSGFVYAPSLRRLAG